MNILSSFSTSEIVFLSYLLLINTVSFSIFGIDKLKAKHDSWRISENTLLISSILGGASGALLGMIVFKHKTSKAKFYIGVPLIFVFTKVLELIIFNNIR